MPRKIYLNPVTPDQAMTDLLAALTVAGWKGEPEELPVEQARGRIMAAPALARFSAPHYHAAAMDGIAVRAADTFHATETNPVRLRLGQDAVWVNTGDPLPPGRDAVIMVEMVNEAGDGEIEIYEPVAPWQHVRPIGEDVAATEVVVPAGIRIGPAEIAALLACGVTRVRVWRQPVVAFIPTGSELIPPGPEPSPGQIIECNSRLVLAMAESWGAIARRWDIVPDDHEKLKEAVLEAVDQSDIVAVNAGSSAGSADHTVHVLQEIGQVVAHGIAIRPAKPTLLAIVAGKPVLGLPGYPVSARLAADLFLKPLVYQFQSSRPPEAPKVTATLGRRLSSPMGVDDYVLVQLGHVGSRLVAIPISRGAGVITSLSRADGMLVVGADREGIEEGTEVTVELWRSPEEIARAVVASGSHDIILDLLSSWLHRRSAGFTLSSAHVGSLAGLAALGRGEAHMAGIHLLDPATGEYNVAYVRRYLRQPARLVLLCRRQQGFMVAPGNPKGIRSVADLARPGIRFVNRQRGAGTRLLLDYELARNGIQPEQVEGYGHEQYTHLACAAAVRAGGADCALGILAAAQALGLDFVPLAQEEYELCIPAAHWDHPGVQAVLRLIQDPEFQQEVCALGGYDMSEAGRVRAVE
ncbi:MAG: molybdopterin biosynthesis protein [Firmicutes bacterium]|nr:molybdopterin biosynthesis protein [Bacillota bacterium]